MDSQNKILVDNFVTFLIKQFQTDKHLRHVQFEHTSLEAFKLKLKYFYHEKEGYIFLDIRELKENKDHFLHLIGTVTDQLQKMIKI